MKKLLKLSLALIMVGGVCFVGSHKIGAATIYTATADSDSHSFAGKEQFFRVNAEMSLVNSSSSVNSYTYKWFSSGEGRYYQPSVSKTKVNGKHVFSATSKIGRIGYNTWDSTKVLEAYIY